MSFFCRWSHVEIFRHKYGFYESEVSGVRLCWVKDDSNSDLQIGAGPEGEIKEGGHLLDGRRPAGSAGRTAAMTSFSHFPPRINGLSFKNLRWSGIWSLMRWYLCVIRLNRVPCCTPVHSNELEQPGQFISHYRDDFDLNKLNTDDIRSRWGHEFDIPATQVPERQIRASRRSLELLIFFGFSWKYSVPVFRQHCIRHFNIYLFIFYKKKNVLGKYPCLKLLSHFQANICRQHAGPNYQRFEDSWSQ